MSDRNLTGPGGKSLAGPAVRKSLHTWNDEEKLPEWYERTVQCVFAMGY